MNDAAPMKLFSLSLMKIRGHEHLAAKCSKQVQSSATSKYIVRVLAHVNEQGYTFFGLFVSPIMIMDSV